MPQTSAAFENLVDLDPVLTEIFFQNYAQLQPMLLNNVIGLRNSTKAKETHARVGSFGNPQPWDGQVYYDEAQPDYEIEWKHAKYSQGFKVEREMLRDMQYDSIFDRAAALGQSFNRFLVEEEASIFNNAFATVLGYDLKTLCATDHPRSKSDSTSVSNYLGTKALNEDNLEQAIYTLESLGDDRGNETGAMATHLVVGRQLRRKALELTVSDKAPESANNATNVNQGIIPIIHPMITGKKWFVLDGPAALRMILFYIREGVEFGTEDDASKTQNRSYFATERHSKGWQDWRCVVGANPT